MDLIGAKIQYLCTNYSYESTHHSLAFQANIYVLLLQIR